MKRTIIFALLTTAWAVQSAMAGQYATALGNCVYNSLSTSDKNVMVQWAFVNLGKTNAAKQITVIPESKIKAVNASAKSTLTRILTQNCAKEAADVALHESKNGVRDSISQLAVRIAQEQLKGSMDDSLSGLLNPGTANVLKGAQVLKDFFKKPGS